MKHLGAEFDAIYTTEKIGTYKPDVGNCVLFTHLLAEQGIARERILHVAQSLYHDIQPAKLLRMDNVWIDRQDLSIGDDWGATSVITEWRKVDAVFTDLASFAQAAVNSRGIGICFQQMRGLAPSAGPEPCRCLFHITPVIYNSYFTLSFLLY